MSCRSCKYFEKVSSNIGNCKNWMTIKNEELVPRSYSQKKVFAFGGCNLYEQKDGSETSN